jgi:zeaxanthin glucosyltransferase
MAMKHVGIICPAANGHLNPMLALGRALRQRGHAVSLVASPRAQAKVVASDVALIRIGGSPDTAGPRDPQQDDLAELTGEEAFRRVMNMASEAADLLVDEGPVAIRAARVDALLVDQVSKGGELVAEALALPFVTVCNALAMYLDLDVPPWTTTWGYDPSPAGRSRNLLGYAQIVRRLQSQGEKDRARRDRLGLPPVRKGGAERALAIVAQQPEFLDFPRRNLPPQFHYTGPFRDDVTETGISFPYDRLDGPPLIYASLGTLHNRLSHVFVAIAEACARLQAQLVISLGRSGLVLPPNLPGSPVVVPYAPQRALMRRASLVITSAGLNTALDSLDRGLPMVAVPVSHEQPGIAARIAYIGAGEFVPLDQIRGGQLDTAVARVFTEERYRLRAREAQEAIARADGLQQAANIVEKTLVSGRPVLRANHSREPVAGN